MEKEQVVVIGANGQLGTDICSVFKREDYCDLIELNHSDIEISSIDSCNDVVRALNPNIIINASAFHDLEKCEEDPITAYGVNALGPRNLAIISKDIGAELVHISTDYVFNGEKSPRNQVGVYDNSPYIESDLAEPLNVYGNTKLSGERFISSTISNYYIFRTSALYGNNICRSKNAPNFIERMISLAETRESLKVVNDEIVSPTPTKFLAKQIALVLSCKFPFGLYHATSQGACSWYMFTMFIFKELGIDLKKLEIASPGEFRSEVKRPLYSVLDNYKLRNGNIDIMPHWTVGVEEYLKNRKVDNNE